MSEPEENDNKATDAPPATQAPINKPRYPTPANSPEKSDQSNAESDGTNENDDSDVTHISESSFESDVDFSVTWWFMNYSRAQLDSNFSFILWHIILHNH